MIESPSFVQIEPVGQCNLRCQMCPIQFRRDGPPWGPPAFIGFDDFKRLIDGFTRVAELHLQGLGEPMMHPHFFDMIEYAAAKGIRVSTNSNLTFLSPARAERCVTSGLDGICVSIDGATAETYERIRVGAHFESVVDHLKLLMEARQRHAARKPWVRLIMVLMRQNLDELPLLVERAHEWGVNDMSVQHLCHDFGEASLPEHYAPMRDFVNEQTLRADDLPYVDDVFAHARSFADGHGITLRLPNIIPKIHPAGTPGPERCDWPWRGAYIAYDGRAMPCCMVATPDRANFGNAITDGPENVWNNDAYQKFRDQLASDEPPAVCRSCSLYKGTF